MTMSSRDHILGRLHAAPRPFEDRPAVTERLPMAPVNDTSPEGLLSRFVDEAEALGCSVTRCADPDQAIEYIMGLIGPDQVIQSWDFAHIPLPNLPKTLAEAGIRVSNEDTTARIGLTGADTALAGTGSLVLVTGPGKPRQPSLMPPVHIAVVTGDLIVPNLDTWITSFRADDFRGFRSASNIVVLSGPSRTGDIANIPVKGVHGPGTVHVILIAKHSQASPY